MRWEGSHKKGNLGRGRSAREEARLEMSWSWKETELGAQRQSWGCEAHSCSLPDAPWSFLADPLISKSASLPAYRRNGLHRVSAFPILPGIPCCPRLLQAPSAPFPCLLSCLSLLCIPAVTAALCPSKMTLTGVLSRQKLPQGNFQRDAGVAFQQKSFALYPGLGIAWDQEFCSWLFETQHSPSPSGERADER